MLLNKQVFEQIIQTCLNEKVGLIIDRSFSSPMIYVPPQQVESCKMVEDHSLSWSHGVVDLIDVQGVRCGGKPGELIKELLGEDKAKDFDDAIARLSRRSKN